MKKITRLSVATALLGAALALPGTVRAQRLSDFTVAQQNRIDSLKQDYIRKGVSTYWAEKRATMIVESESKAQLRSSTRLSSPVTGSIRVDRGSTPGSYSSHHNDTPEQLLKTVLLNNPAAASAISNVHFTGIWTANTRSLAYFEYEGNDFPIEKGLLLASGDVLGTSTTSSAEGPHQMNGGALNGGVNMMGDADLTPLLNPSQHVGDGSWISFDFKPYSSQVTFDFVFASEEYPRCSNTQFNDVFGFFITDLDNPGVKQNIAYFPDGATRVTINNSNWGNYTGTYTQAAYPAPLTGAYPAVAVHPEWHVPNYIGSPVMEYGGRTVKLTAKATGLSTSKTYRLELKIANVNDGLWGSGVFLANLDLGTPKVGVDQPYMGAWDSTWDKKGEDNLYCNCVQTLNLRFTPDPAERKVVFSYLGIASKENIVMANGQPFPDTITLAAGDSVISIPFQTLSVPLKDNGKEGAVLACIVGGGCDTLMNKATGNFFKFYSGISTNIEFEERTTMYAGKFKLNITGGSNDLYRSIDKGLHWELARDPLTGEERPFTSDQMDYFMESDRTVWLREPNACPEKQFYHFTKDSLPGTVLPNHPRLVLMPKVAGLVSSYTTGYHYVNSGSNLTFRVMPTGVNAGKVPVVETGRTSIPDSKGVRVVSNGDGTYTVTVYRVREAIDLRISFVNNPDNNVEADGTSIYADRGVLHLTSPVAGMVKVYNISGALVRTLKLSAGETVRMALPAGFYVVATENGNTHKVIVR